MLSYKSMRLVRQIKLHFNERNSDKVYEVDLCEAGNDEFIVNFRYGRRGQRLKEGTKTAFPGAKEKAEKIFEKLVQQKKNKGYRELSSRDDESPSEPLSPPSAADSANGSGSPEQRKHLAKHLRNAIDSGKGAKNWSLSRILWRAGEMQGDDFLDALLQVEVGKDMEAYALAWSLARSRSEKAADKLQALAKSNDEAVRRIAIEGLLLCLNESDAAELAASQRELLPEAIRANLESDDATVASMRRLF